MTKPELDKEGYLINLKDWNHDIAIWLATTDNIQLTDDHWEIIQALQHYYHLYEHAPSQRPLLKHIANTLGKEKGNSIYLMQLFHGSPAKTAARIAGLPRPSHCF